jgi:hypothetical protein
MTEETTGRSRRRHPAARARITVAGIGLAAMLGLVSKMEVADGQAKSRRSPTTASPLDVSARSLAAERAMIAALATATKARRPIVLTPHAVVSSVTVASSGGGGGSGGGSGSRYVAAPARAAAPVASTSGSH